MLRPRSTTAMPANGAVHVGVPAGGSRDEA